MKKRPRVPAVLTGDNKCRPMGWGQALESMGAHPRLVDHIERLAGTGLYGAHVGRTIVRLLEMAVATELDRHFPTLVATRETTTRGVIGL